VPCTVTVEVFACGGSLNLHPVAQKRRYADLVVGEQRISSPKRVELAQRLEFARRQAAATLACRSINLIEK